MMKFIPDVDAGTVTLETDHVELVFTEESLHDLIDGLMTALIAIKEHRDRDGNKVVDIRKPRTRRPTRPGRR